MTIYTFDHDSQRRIAGSVLWTERQPRREPRPRRRIIGSIAPVVAFAAADIEHNTFGNCDLATGNDFDSSLSADTDQRYSVYNPCLKIWSGSRLIISQVRLPSGRPQYNIIQHHSATRIRCTAPSGGIAAGGSGTCTSPTDANGHFGATTLTVYSWLSSIAIQGSEEMLAELYWDSSNTESRWRVYSADCT